MTLCYGFLRLFVVIQRIVYPVEWVMYAFGKYSLKSLVELFFEWEKAVLFNEGSFMTEPDESAVKYYITT